MTAIPLSRPPSTRPSAAISSGAHRDPVVRRASGRPVQRPSPVIRARLTPARTANSADARPPASHWAKVRSPAGVRSSSTWVATMPSSARQRATSSPTSRRRVATAHPLTVAVVGRIWGGWSACPRSRSVRTTSPTATSWSASSSRRPARVRRARRCGDTTRRSPRCT